MNERVVIVGGGPVGLAFAKDVSTGKRLTIAVVEKTAPSRAAPTGPLDHRVFALAPKTQRFLARLGVWQYLPAGRIEPIRAMQVFGDRADSQLDFNARQPLAYVVEHQALIAALWQSLDGVENVLAYAGHELASWAKFENAHTLTIRDGRELEANLLVGADGPNSWIRQHAGIASRVEDYASVAVVANFDCEMVHAGIARQWFSGDGILAYLPLPGRRVSIVWSVTDREGERLCKLAPDELSQQVAEAGHHALGRLWAISPVAKFPLRRALAQTWVQPGLALIGDAAHSVHPLAGQGVNLGFADASVLAKTVRERGRFSSIGDYALLRGYERSRREEVIAMATISHELRRLYQRPSTMAGWVRNEGLKLVNCQQLIKEMMMDYAMA